jgi:hypothetical protein
MPLELRQLTSFWITNQEGARLGSGHHLCAEAPVVFSIAQGINDINKLLQA